MPERTPPEQSAAFPVPGARENSSRVQDPTEVRGRAVVVNSRGLHARPCHSLARIALEFAGEIEICCEDRVADGKSILELMTLSAGHGSVLEFRARGHGAQDVIRSLVGMVDAGFQETD
ncbi:MAG TPA: HPr family phosphocarrier protein [Planctomycetota bacterium]|nr:HPr family phosphocarrier protein [Planctomycetota bacterium]